MVEISKGNPLTVEQPDKEEAPQIIHNYHFYEGSKANFPGSQDHSQIIHAENVQINQGITASQILSLLRESGDSRQLFAQKLAEQVQKSIFQDMLPRLTRGEGVGEEEFAQQYDEEYARAGGCLIGEVQVDEEADLLDVAQEELETLDLRFEEARRRCRANVTDALLEQQSERCQFYIKLSVVVEDALNFPGAFQMNDFSPQLVLYGKTLEQSLRDNLYELFHQEERLSIYNTHSHSEDAGSPEAFKNKTLEQTYIGNYAFLIGYKKDYLGSLCMTHQVFYKGIDSRQAWSLWWNKLQLDIHSARKIRNLTDHADEISPDREKLDSMCGLLFGNGEEVGILDRIRVGRFLTAKLFPPRISEEAIEELVGCTCEMKCTHLKSNGGMKGELCEGGYAVNISPRKAKRYRDSLSGQNFEPEGEVFSVKLLEYKSQNGIEFFSGEITG